MTPCPSTVGGSPCLLPSDHNGSHLLTLANGGPITAEQAADILAALKASPCLRPPVPSAPGDKDNA